MPHSGIHLIGHKLVVEHNGERGIESASTGRCICGRWQESASSQRIVRSEYRRHLIEARNQQSALEARLRRG